MPRTSPAAALENPRRDTMIKSLMLGAAMIVAVPALAQTGSTNPDTNKPGTSSTSPGQTMAPPAPATSSTAPGATADSGWGTTGATSNSASSIGAGTTANGTATWNAGSAAYTGRGGPAMGAEGGKSYPACSRTLRDNCMQRGGGHSRHHRR
jgi:hypothetical protein